MLENEPSLTSNQNQGNDATQQTSRCLVLKNAGSPDEIDSLFEEDIRSECEKFGEIEKLVIKSDSQSVRVYILYKEISSCTACQSKLNGKYYGVHCIETEFYDEHLFNKKVFAM
ncbi:hypothetical protein ACTFIU_009755 [Dictyostelium citrinum]